MASNIINQVPYLRSSRNFPEDPHELTVQINKSYVDIANAVNNRTVGIFTTGPSLTGENWFIGNVKRQTLRQLWKIDSIASFDHNIDFSNVYFFTRQWGNGFDGTNYYPIPYITPSPLGATIGFSVTPTQVVLTSSPGTAIIILEWMTNS